MNTAGYAQEAAMPEKGMAPSKATLIDILTEKRKQLLAELRDIEQAVEALEGQPNFEPMFNKLSALLQRRY